MASLLAPLRCMRPRVWRWFLAENDGHISDTLCLLPFVSCREMPVPPAAMFTTKTCFSSFWNRSMAFCLSSADWPPSILPHPRFWQSVWTVSEKLTKITTLLPSKTRASAISTISGILKDSASWRARSMFTNTCSLSSTVPFSIYCWTISGVIPAFA